MVDLNFDEFDDELRTMQELMEEEITLKDDSLVEPIRSLRLKRAIVVSVGTSVQNCIQLMLARRIGCILVVDQNEKLCGIFTERDVLKRIAGRDLDLDRVKIDDYLTPNPVALRLNDTILSALKLMHEGRYRHVSVVDDDDKPVTVVSIKDIISFIAEFFPRDVLNLPPHPIRIGTKHREGG